MSKLTCRECGQDEHPGERRPDKLQAGKLQARIKELEELIPTKDEAVRVLNYLIEMHKPNYHYAHNSPHFYSIYHAFNKCLICSYISKLQKIIDLTIENKAQPVMEAHANVGDLNTAKVWKFEVENFAALPDVYKVADMVKIRKVVIAGVKIPGVKAWQEDLEV